MGEVFSSNESVPHLQRLRYDLSLLKERNLPVIWLNGVKCSGRKTQGNMICQKFSLENILVSELIHVESTKDTDRGRILKEALVKFKSIPDTLVIDLIKEAMLKADSSSKGYVICKFPKNKKQANLFVKEIGDVDLILFLETEMSSIIERAKRLTNDKLPVEIIRKEAVQNEKELSKMFSKYPTKTEKIESCESATEVFFTVVNRVNKMLRIRDILLSSIKALEKVEEPEREVRSSISSRSGK